MGRMDNKFTSLFISGTSWEFKDNKKELDEYKKYKNDEFQNCSKKQIYYNKALIKPNNIPKKKSSSKYSNNNNTKSYTFSNLINQKYIDNQNNILQVYSKILEKNITILSIQYQIWRFFHLYYFYIDDETNALTK